MKLKYELIATIARHVMRSYCLRHKVLSLCGPALRILWDGSMDVAGAERKSKESISQLSHLVLQIPVAIEA